MNEKNNNLRHREVIQRYCPKCGENVIMLRSRDDSSKTECMNYDLCLCSKDKFCGTGGK